MNRALFLLAAIILTATPASAVDWGKNDPVIEEGDQIKLVYTPEYHS